MPGFIRAARAAALTIAALVSIGSSSAAWSFDAAPTAGPAPAPAAAAPVLATPTPTSAPALSATTAPSAQPRPLADIVIAQVLADEIDAELECLATAVYFESRGEPVEGQLAVAEVVLNRAASGRYPPSVCGVVTQRAQFSFVRGGRLPSANRTTEAWRTALAVAQVARDRLADQVAPNVLWYHATYASPGWGRRLTRVAQIGTHIFYS